MCGIAPILKLHFRNTYLGSQMNLNTALKTEEKMKKNFPIICIN